MKKLMILFGVILPAIFAQAQNPSKTVNIYSNCVVDNHDTAYTFTIHYPNYEECRKILMLSWGRPDAHEAGKIVWNKLNLSGIGNEMEVTLYDGIFTMDTKGGSFAPFVNDQEKYDKIPKLKPEECRQLVLIFESQDGKNLIRQKEMADNIRLLLLKILQ